MKSFQNSLLSNVFRAALDVKASYKQWPNKMIQSWSWINGIHRGSALVVNQAIGFISCDEKQTFVTITLSWIFLTYSFEAKRKAWKHLASAQPVTIVDISSTLCFYWETVIRGYLGTMEASHVLHRFWSSLRFAKSLIFIKHIVAESTSEIISGFFVNFVKPVEVSDGL